MSEKITHVGGVQERLNQLRHGCFVSELRCIAFYGPQAGIRYNAVRQRRLADTRWAVQEDNTWISGGWCLGPGQQGRIMVAVNQGTPFF